MKNGDVIVLGAGCSRSYTGQIMVPNLHCPLQSDFFDMIRIYMRHKQRHSSYIGVGDPIFRVVYALADLLGYREDKDDHPLEYLIKIKLSLEDAFSILDLCQKEKIFNHFLRAPNKDSRKYLVQLTDLTAEVLAVSLSGKPCDLHQRLAEYIKSGDTVISYNYDTLIDEALEQKSSFGKSGYFIPFMKSLKFFPSEEEGLKYIVRWILVSEDSSAIGLLKLHGSLNWLRCEKCDSIFLDRGLEGWRFMNYLAETYKEGWNSQHHYSILCPKCDLGTLERLIIPPLLQKSFSNPFYTVLWRQAQKALFSANRIIVIGYSLPMGDFHSRLLFQLCSLPRSKFEISERTLIVVNPDQQVAERLKILIRHRDFYHFNSLENFLVAVEAKQILLNK